MHNRRQPLSSIFVVALGLMYGWLSMSTVAVGADGAEGFTLYAPSVAERRLLVVRPRLPLV